MTVEESQTVEAGRLDLYMAPMGELALRHCATFAQEIRALGRSVEVGFEGKLKRMLELANKMGARYALIVGDNEIVTQSYTLRDMVSGEQTTLSRQGVLERFSR